MQKVKLNSVFSWAAIFWLLYLVVQIFAFGLDSPQAEKAAFAILQYLATSVALEILNLSQPSINIAASLWAAFYLIYPKIFHNPAATLLFSLYLVAVAAIHKKVGNGGRA